jgi:hypothetical protein
VKIPTKAELNGRALYTVLSEITAEGDVAVLYCGTDPDHAWQVARDSQGGVVVTGAIGYDAREMDQE